MKIKVKLWPPVLLEKHGPDIVIPFKVWVR